MELKDRGINVIKKHKAFNIIITHLHSDHIGSLPSLIFYCKYVLNKNITIIHPRLWQIIAYLSLSGVPTNAYSVYCRETCIDEGATISFIEEDHTITQSCGIDVNVLIDEEEGYTTYNISEGKYLSYGLIINIFAGNKSKTIYYSSDTMTPLYNIKILDKLCDYYYYDSAVREENSEGDKYPHCNLLELVKSCNESQIPLDRLRLMHIDSDEVIELAKILDIKCVEVE